MKFEDYLSDIEKATIKRFLANERMVNTVKKVLLAAIYDNGILKPNEKPDPTRNYLLGLMGQSRQLPNKHLGEVLRAQMEGITALENGFKLMEGLDKPGEEVVEENNPGR